MSTRLRHSAGHTSCPGITLNTFEGLHEESITVAAHEWRQVLEALDDSLEVRA